MSGCIIYRRRRENMNGLRERGVYIVVLLTVGETKEKLHVHV